MVVNEREGCGRETHNYEGVKEHGHIEMKAKIEFRNHNSKFSDLGYICFLDYSIHNAYKAILDWVIQNTNIFQITQSRMKPYFEPEFEVWGGCASDVEARRKGFVMVARRWGEVKRKIERRREWARREE